jgi:hypothetical protein
LHLRLRLLHSHFADLHELFDEGLRALLAELGERDAGVEEALQDIGLGHAGERIGTAANAS